MRARSASTGAPAMSRPSTSGSVASEARNCSDSSSWRRLTLSRREFGSSMPMALRPETTAARTEGAPRERAISSASPITRDDLTPRAGSNSKSVTTGPG